MSEPVVYDNLIGTNALHEAGTVRRDQWRVRWTHWPPGRERPNSPERVHDHEASARQQYEGLLSMLAGHDLRPCGEHVWKPKLERRTVWESPWREVEDGP